MKLEKFKAGNKKKITTISIMTIIIILLVGIIIYQSYALYEDKKTFNVINGTVPVFGEISRKIELAYTIEGSASNDPFPNINDGYGAKKVTCESGVEAEWNDVAWSLIIKNSKNNKQIKCTIDFIKTKIYGVERSINSSSTAWTRTNNAQGLVANAQVGTTAVRNDFDNIYPWNEIKSYNYNTSTKKITAWYGDSNFKFDGTNGEVLTYIPKFYYKRYQDEEKEYVSIANRRLEGYTKSEAFSVGRYIVSGDINNVHSKSGQMPLVNTLISEYRNPIRNLGEEFNQMDYHWFIIQLLYLVEYADYNSQAKLGPGYTNSTNTGPIKSGGCDSLGMHSGSVDGTDKSQIIYRGIEDIIGNTWIYLDGINARNAQAYICYDPSRYESNKFDGCYQKLGYVSPNVNGHITKLGYDNNHPLISLTTEIGDINSNHIISYYTYATGDTVSIIGRGYNDGGGLWSWLYVGLDVRFDDTSARIIKIN